MSDVVDDFLEHYGKKGMRWGQRKEHKTWLKEAKSGETATKVYQDAVKSFGPTLKKLNKDPAFADMATNRNTRREYDAVMSRIFNQHLADASIRTFNPNLKRAVIYQMTPDGSMLKATESKLVEHADKIDVPVFKLIRDKDGFIVDVVFVESTLAQTNMFEKDFLSHYGKKGMRWGQRKNRGFVKPSKKTAPEKPKAKDLSDEELRKAVNRMNMEKQYNALIKGSSNKKGAEFVKSIGSTAVKTALTAVATQQVNSALKKAKIAK